MPDSNQHSDPRCGNTIDSYYVTDHRCQRERGHLGDCWFGVGFVEQYEGVAAELRVAQAQITELTRDGGGDSIHLRIAAEARERMHVAEDEAASLKEQLEAAQRQLQTEAGWTANDLDRERKLKEQNEALRKTLERIRDSKYSLWDAAEEVQRIKRMASRTLSDSNPAKCRRASEVLTEGMCACLPGDCYQDRDPASEPGGAS